MNELQYRVNFFVQLVQSLLALGTGLVVLALVFDRTDGARRLDPSGAARRHGRLHDDRRDHPHRHRAEHDSGCSRTSSRHARLRADQAGGRQCWSSVREVRIWQAVDIVVGAVVIVVAVVPARRLRVVVRSPASCCCSSSARMMRLLLLVAPRQRRRSGSCGWTRCRSSSAASTAPASTRSASIPAGCRLALTFLVPLAFAVTVPSEAITSRLDLGGALTAVVMAVALVAVSRTVFRRGLRRYSGASS